MKQTKIGAAMNGREKVKKMKRKKRKRGVEKKKRKKRHKKLAGLLTDRESATCRTYSEGGTFSEDREKRNSEK